MSFDVAGQAGAPAIVFIHGTRLTRAAWRPQMGALADEFRTIAVDLPGHGELAGEPFTLAAAAGAVRHAIDEAGGGRAVVVGLSLGGYVAMELAASSPERVRGLVLAGATAEPLGVAKAPYLALAWVMATFAGPQLDAVNRWFFRTRFPSEIAEPVIDAGFWSVGGATALRALSGERFRPRLAAFPGPTLILNGEFDLPFRLGAGSFSRVARDPRRVLLKGASHLANLDRPAAFNLAVRRFARSLDAPEGTDRTGRSEGPRYTAPTLLNPSD